MVSQQIANLSRLTPVSVRLRVSPPDKKRKQRLKKPVFILFATVGILIFSLLVVIGFCIEWYEKIIDALIPA